MFCAALPDSRLESQPSVSPQENDDESFQADIKGTPVILIVIDLIAKTILNDGTFVYAEYGRASNYVNCNPKFKFSLC